MRKNIVQNISESGNAKKALAIMFLLCPLAISCAKPTHIEKKLLENENNINEVEHRISSLEHRVDGVDSALQTASTRVYDVRNKSGRSTGMTAHPRVEPKPVASTTPAVVTPASTTTTATTTPPVAHVSPISDPKNTSATPVVPVTPATPVTPVATATPASTTDSSLTTNLSSSPRAPMGVLDSSLKSEGVDMKDPNSSPALSLPPENAVYAPSKDLPPSPVVPATTPPVAVMPADTTQQQAVVTPAAQTPVAPATAPKPVSGEQGAYKQALDLVLAGKLVQGREQFNAFLQKYPSGRYTPNVYYWVGETYYAQKNYTEALLSFKQVTSAFPKHHKTPDALLKAGMTYERLGDMENAKLQYQALITDFPSSNAARIARSKKL